MNTDDISVPQSIPPSAGVNDFETNQWFKSLVENMVDIVTVVDDKGNMIYESPSTKINLAYKQDEQIGENVFRFIHPDDVALAQEIFTKAFGDVGVTYEMEIRYRHKDGSWHDFHISGKVIKNTTGALNAVIVSHDITQRKQSELQLKKLSTAVAQSPTSIVITDIQGRIEYVNDTFTQVTGYTRQEVVGQNPRILKSGVNKPEVYTQLWEVITKGGTWHGELINKKKNGDLFTEFASISGIKDDTGAVMSYLAVKEDITERKLKEDELNNTLHRLETIVQNAPVIVWALDKNGIFTLSQGKGLSGLGLHEGEVVGKNVDEVFADIPQILDEKKRALSGEAINSIVLVRGRVFETYQLPTKNASGEIVGMSGIAVDITQQKKNEEELREKVAEATRFNELTVGRELKMAELKKEIEELKKNSGSHGA